MRCVDFGLKNIAAIEDLRVTNYEYLTLQLIAGTDMIGKLQ